MTRGKLGGFLIILGVAVWGVYFALKLGVEYDGPATPFLLVHLLCVVPGAFLAGRGWTRDFVDMLRRREGA